MSPNKDLNARNENPEDRPRSLRRESGRMGRSSVTVAVALIAIVGIVGAVNYVVLNAIGVEHSAGTTTTNTTTSCHPATAPQCQDTSLSADAALIQLMPLARIG